MQSKDALVSISIQYVCYVKHSLNPLFISTLAVYSGKAHDVGLKCHSYSTKDTVMHSSSLCTTSLALRDRKVKRSCKQFSKR